jgi:hypothetical protein
MRNIKSRFEAMTKKYPNHSSFICFGRAVWGQKFSQRFISQHFNELVDKDDYDRSDRKELIKHFLLLTNEPDGDRF